MESSCTCVGRAREDMTWDRPPGGVTLAGTHNDQQVAAETRVRARSQFHRKTRLVKVKARMLLLISVISVIVDVIWWLLLNYNAVITVLLLFSRCLCWYLYCYTVDVIDVSVSLDLLDVLDLLLHQICSHSCWFFSKRAHLSVRRNEAEVGFRF